MKSHYEIYKDINFVETEGRIMILFLWTFLILLYIYVNFHKEFYKCFIYNAYTSRYEIVVVQFIGTKSENSKLCYFLNMV